MLMTEAGSRGGPRELSPLLCLCLALMLMLGVVGAGLQARAGAEPVEAAAERVVTPVAEPVEAAAEPGATAGPEPVEDAADSASPLDPAVKEVSDCMERNLPETTSVQTIHFVHVDRAGGRGDLCRGKLYAKRFEDGRRKIRLCYMAPNAFRGIGFVGHEREKCHDMWVYRPSERRVRRLPCKGGGLIPCSDLTGEDLMRRQGIEPEGDTERLPDEVLEGRPVSVLSSIPEADLSNYDRVTTYVDEETCVVLKEVSYVAEDPVKILTADPASIIEVDGHFVATELRMDDLVELTHTEMAVEEIEFDIELSDRCFDEKTLPETRCRCR